MDKKTLQIARKYPKQAEAILNLFRIKSDRKALTELLGACTCTTDTLGCTCPPEYSTPKGENYSGHLPASN